MIKRKQSGRGRISREVNVIRRTGKQARGEGGRTRRPSLLIPSLFPHDSYVIIPTRRQRGEGGGGGREFVLLTEGNLDQRGNILNSPCFGGGDDSEGGFEVVVVFVGGAMLVVVVVRGREGSHCWWWLWWCNWI